MQGSLKIKKKLKKKEREENHSHAFHLFTSIHLTFFRPPALCYVIKTDNLQST